MKNNFDLKKFLVENKLTKASQVLSENEAYAIWNKDDISDIADYLEAEDITEDTFQGTNFGDIYYRVSDSGHSLQLIFDSEEDASDFSRSLYNAAGDVYEIFRVPVDHRILYIRIPSDFGEDTKNILSEELDQYAHKPIIRILNNYFGGNFQHRDGEYIDVTGKAKIHSGVFNTSLRSKLEDTVNMHWIVKKENNHLIFIPKAVDEQSEFFKVDKGLNEVTYYGNSNVFGNADLNNAFHDKNEKEQLDYDEVFLARDLVRNFGNGVDKHLNYPSKSSNVVKFDGKIEDRLETFEQIKQYCKDKGYTVHIEDGDAWVGHNKYDTVYVTVKKIPGQQN